jgi:hypothetical protein
MKSRQFREARGRKVAGAGVTLFVAALLWSGASAAQSQWTPPPEPQVKPDIRDG